MQQFSAPALASTSGNAFHALTASRGSSRSTCTSTSSSTAVWQENHPQQPQHGQTQSIANNAITRTTQTTIQRIYYPHLSRSAAASLASDSASAIDCLNVAPWASNVEARSSASPLCLSSLETSWSKALREASLSSYHIVHKYPATPYTKNKGVTSAVIKTAISLCSQSECISRRYCLPPC